MKSKKAIAVAFILSMACSAFANDIAGIKLGSPFSAAKPLVMKANPAYKVTDLKTTTGQVTGLVAEVRDSTNPANILDAFLIVHDKAGLVWHIARNQKLEKGQRYKPDALQAALKEKYGEPSEISLGEYYTWQLDRNGQLFIGSTSSGPCQGVDGRFPGQYNLALPNRFNSKCGVLIKVTAGLDFNDKLVSNLNVSVTDVRRIFDEVSAKNTKDEEEKQRQHQKEVKKAKPKL
jgi:hypothetical protein